MTKEVLRQRIKEMGEEPPAEWTRTQLETRFQELKDETSPGQKIQNQLLVEMNRASKKKIELQKYIQERLELKITGNETVARLQTMGHQKIMEMTPPLGSDKMGYGKHANKTYQEVLVSDPSYVDWCHQTSQEKRRHAGR